METYTAMSLTEAEAEVWVLSNFLGPQYVRLTDEAIALLLATPGTSFGEEAESAPAESIASKPTVSQVEERYEQAEEKYEQAKEFVGAVTFQDRDDHLVSPRIAWIDSSTRHRIKGRLNPDENTVDDLVNRLLDETETRRSLEELTRSYLDSRGRDNVAQVALSVPYPEEGTLFLTAHTGVCSDMPEVIAETDAVTVDGERYSFYFGEDPSGPWSGERRLSIYAAADIIGMDGVTVEDGIETVEKRIQEDKKNFAGKTEV